MKHHTLSLLPSTRIRTNTIHVNVTRNSTSSKRVLQKKHFQFAVIIFCNELLKCPPRRQMKYSPRKDNSLNRRYTHKHDKRTQHSSGKGCIFTSLVLKSKFCNDNSGYYLPNFNAVSLMKNDIFNG